MKVVKDQQCKCNLRKMYAAGEAPICGKFKLLCEGCEDCATEDADGSWCFHSPECHLPTANDSGNP